MFGADGTFGLAVVAGLMVDVAEVAAGGVGLVYGLGTEEGAGWDECMRLGKSKTMIN